MSPKAILVLTALAVSACLSGGASARVFIAGEFVVPPVIVAPAAPPPLRPEVVPPPPGPPGIAFWAPGHWEWSGRSYFWVGGHYVERPEVGAIWVPGRWVNRRGVWEWRGGHWRR